MQWLIELMFPRRLHRLAYFLRGLLADIMMLSGVDKSLPRNSYCGAPGRWADAGGRDAHFYLPPAADTATTYTLV